MIGSSEVKASEPHDEFLLAFTEGQRSRLPRGEGDVLLSEQSPAAGSVDLNLYRCRGVSRVVGR